jgi:hypothetical protein
MRWIEEETKSEYKIHVFHRQLRHRASRQFYIMFLVHLCFDYDLSRRLVWNFM